MSWLCMFVCVCTYVRVTLLLHNRSELRLQNRGHGTYDTRQRWRPNGRTDRNPNWYKHSLGQSSQFTRVGDRECALMRGMRAQTCARHYISSIGAQTAGLIETPIGTNTHWGNRHKLWESACARSAQLWCRSRPAQARSGRTSAFRA
jgi:hypothetical protein